MPVVEKRDGRCRLEAGHFVMVLENDNPIRLKVEVVVDGRWHFVGTYGDSLDRYNQFIPAQAKVEVNERDEYRIAELAMTACARCGAELRSREWLPRTPSHAWSVESIHFSTPDGKTTISGCFCEKCRSALRDREGCRRFLEAKVGRQP